MMIIKSPNIFKIVFIKNNIKININIKKVMFGINIYLWSYMISKAILFNIKNFVFNNYFFLFIDLYFFKFNEKINSYIL